ncbi:alpha/beta hydrolase [Nonomuraea pusilla]|uniref:Dienelactone hydrolase n=1 Tax=Nonomuraea pusilla TaxID=46177 RepID=A0A1H8ILZ7_9ACTN|nr:hypothetical protein [Nonomuraea pusilla]SEN69564.1 Dienelactone hydrolase [Nonomuraea pusilla]
MRRIVGSLALVLAVTACGGEVTTASGGGTASASPAPSGSASAAATTAPPAETPAPLPTGPNVSGCFTEKDGVIFKHANDLPGVITGKGPVGVVITYERRGSVCDWRPLSDRLVAAGYRVLLYNRDSSIFPEDGAVAMGKRLAKEKGVKRIFVVGGSIGATTAVPAAERLVSEAKGVKVAGVVALSGEADTEKAAALTVPLLQIGSENDGYGGADSIQRIDAAATKAPDKDKLIIAGESLHASALFDSRYGQEVIEKIVTFMDRHKG